MLGRDAAAEKDFNEAERLFKSTKDRRGIAYCMISKGQLAFKKDVERGRRILTEAHALATSLGIKVEAGYAKKVLSAMNAAPQKLPLNLA
ncbi:MAG: hypothetical protein HY884_04335 [Deltaproteobacteria bacterium]|nr:hypothetical protein [Deltaproteobacteria bacterium]